MIDLPQAQARVTRTDHPILEYVPHQSPRRRKLLVWVKRFTLAAFSLAAVLWFGPKLLHNAVVWRAQNRLMGLVQPGSAPDTTLARAAWRQLYALLSPPGTNSERSWIVGERRSPGGGRRLVVVDVFSNLSTGRGRGTSLGVRLLATAVEQGNLARSARIVSQSPIAMDNWPAEATVTLAADDPSRFLITATHGGRTLMADGWLLDDDTIVIEPRGDAATAPAGQ